MSFVRILCLLVVANLLFGCATPQTKGERENIKSIGILNKFPDNPTWTIIGTTVFSNKMAQAEPRGYKEFLSSSVIDYLRGRGYKVREISQDELTSAGDIDYILKFVPWDAERFMGTLGYGFVEGSVLGLKFGPSAYTVMHIYPFVRDGASFSERRGTYLEKFESLPITEMPGTWGELPDNKKIELEKALKKCIESSVQTQLRELVL